MSAELTGSTARGRADNERARASASDIDLGPLGRTTKAGLFSRFAKRTSAAAGQPLTFALAVVLVVGWAATGPLFNYSETWQLVINTSTTIITFLMVFLIQNTQNRDLAALHVKLDELIRATEAASNAVLAAEDDEQVERIEESYKRLAQAREGVERQERA